MKSIRWHRRIMTAVFAAALPMACAFAEDVVTYMKQGQEDPAQEAGKVREDNYMGVKLSVGAAELPIKRELVVSVKYDGMPKEMDNVPSYLETEQWAEAEKALKTATSRLASVDPIQKKLIEQYIDFSTAECDRLQGKTEDAVKGYRNLIAKMPQTRFYAEALLGIGKAYEDQKNSDSKKRFEALKNAMQQYTTAAADFQTKMGEARALMPAYALARFGVLRVQVAFAMSSDAAARAPMIEKCDKGLEALMDDLRGLGGDAVSDDVKLAAKEARALIWKGQENWKELAAFLDKQVLEAQQKKQKARLEALYLQRADANYELKITNAALVDYLRIALVYEPSGEVAARANYRIGECLVTLKGTDWLERAKKHLGRAQTSGIAPWKDMAGTLFTKITSKTPAN